MSIRVDIFAGESLTEKEYDVLGDALNDAYIEDAIHDLVDDALRERLPSRYDDIEWFKVKVKEAL